jgi:hypothetical protein
MKNQIKGLMMLKAKKNATTAHCGLLVEHFEGSGDAASLIISRAFDRAKSASIDFIIEYGCYSDDAETPLTVKEQNIAIEILHAYEAAGLI